MCGRYVVRIASGCFIHSFIHSFHDHSSSFIFVGSAMQQTNKTNSTVDNRSTFYPFLPTTDPPMVVSIWNCIICPWARTRYPKRVNIAEWTIRPIAVAIVAVRACTLREKNRRLRFLLLWWRRRNNQQRNYYWISSSSTSPRVHRLPKRHRGVG
jgi:hypothetical protein